MIRHEAIGIDTKRIAPANVSKDAEYRLHNPRIDKDPLAIPSAKRQEISLSPTISLRRKPVSLPKIYIHTGSISKGKQNGELNSPLQRAKAKER
jgi:hypothetical protein